MKYKNQITKDIATPINEAISIKNKNLFSSNTVIKDSILLSEDNGIQIEIDIKKNIITNGNDINIDNKSDDNNIIILESVKGKKFL